MINNHDAFEMLLEARVDLTRNEIGSAIEYGQVSMLQKMIDLRTTYGWMWPGDSFTRCYFTRNQMKFSHMYLFLLQQPDLTIHERDVRMLINKEQTAIFHQVIEHHFHLQNTDDYLSIIHNCCEDGQLEMLQMFVTKYPFSSYLTKEQPCLDLQFHCGFTPSKHLPIIKYLFEECQLPLHRVYTSLAAFIGSMELLQYLHSIQCPWDHLTTESAAKTGHLNCLQYAHEHGCEWIWDSAAAAAEYDELECLEYIHKHGGPCTDQVYLMAVMNGNHKILQYAFANHLQWYTPEDQTWESTVKIHFDSDDEETEYDKQLTIFLACMMEISIDNDYWRCFQTILHCSLCDGYFDDTLSSMQENSSLGCMIVLLASRYYDKTTEELHEFLESIEHVLEYNSITYLDDTDLLDVLKMGLRNIYPFSREFASNYPKLTILMSFHMELYHKCIHECKQHILVNADAVIDDCLIPYL